jgi:hypothetical protein
LTQVLSWYEGLDLGAILRLRTVSPWVNDPERVQQRQEVAHRIAKWSNIRAFTASLVSSESESDYADSEEDDAASGEAEDEVPEGDDAASDAAPEKVTPRDATSSPIPEATETEVHPDAPTGAADPEGEAAPAPAGAASEVSAPEVVAPEVAASGVAASEVSVEKPTSPTA